MSNYSAGHEAEKLAAKHIEEQGFKLRDLNWKTRYCEIDLVAEKDKRMYFIEVKYRERSAWGSGVDYITLKKLKQMSFAAEMWVSNHGWQGEYQLAAIEMSGLPPKVTNFLVDL